MTSAYPAKIHINTLATHLLSAASSVHSTLTNSKSDSDPTTDDKADQTQKRRQRHILYLQGQHTLLRDDTDRELPFHQEANFHYLTGCLIPGSALVVIIEDENEDDGPSRIGSETSGLKIRAKLFIPPFDSDAAMWSVPPPSIEAIALPSPSSPSPSDPGSNKKVVSTGTQNDTLDFGITELGYVGEPLENHLTSLFAIDETENESSTFTTSDETETIFHLLSTNPLDPLFPTIPTPVLAILHPSPTSTSTPAHTSTTSPSIFTLTDTLLRPSLHRSRLIKSPLEIEYIREANRITSVAHEVLMRELGRFARVRARARGGVIDTATAPNMGGSGDEGEQGTNGKGGPDGLDKWEIKSEQDAEAVFVAACKRMGANQAYLPIVASGSRASTLHYVCNDRLFPFTSTSTSGPSNDFTQNSPPTGRGCCGSIPLSDPSNPQESDLNLSDAAFTPQVLLIDAGCEVRGGYASDVTRTIPIGNGGKFTREGRWVYELVLKMQKAAEGMLRPGVHWDDLHFECHRILCEAFLDAGIFKGATVDEILKKGLTAAFYPHGLGHSLGLDVHDSLQLLRSEHIGIPQRSLDHPTLFRYLRIRRPILEGMVLTIEPGCYFSPNLMESFGIRQSEFVDTDVLDQYTGVGGVRIEDGVVVTRDGYENLTTVGREADWIEGVCSGTL